MRQSARSPGARHRPSPQSQRTPAGRLIVPFRGAAEAWLWTMQALVARREGSPRGFDGSGPPRPATPDEVLRCLDDLYRDRRLDLLHARVLRFWGERGRPPNPSRSGERCDAAIWQEAMLRLEWPLRIKGFLADPPG